MDSLLVSESHRKAHRSPKATVTGPRDNPLYRGMTPGRLLGLCALFVCMWSTSSLSAEITTKLDNIEVDGKLYTATFHSGDISFNDLWDANGDRIFGNDGSLFNRAPAFFEQFELATEATNAIIDSLGVDGITGAESGPEFATDFFLVPVSFEGESFADHGLTFGDSVGLLELDIFIHIDSRFDGSVFDFPLVSFAPVMVPIPAIWMSFSAILIGLGVHSCHRSGQ